MCKHRREYNQGAVPPKNTFYQYGDPHVKDHDRVIFNMGIPIPGKDSLYIEMEPSPPRSPVGDSHSFPIDNGVIQTLITSLVFIS